MDTRPVGVFDSGLGGLTAVRQLTACMPEERIVYFGDTGRVPYGSRSRGTIRRYARQDAAFLLSQDVKMIVAACGTVSSVAADLGQELPVPFLGVLGPTAQAAAAATRTGRIGVIGTTATIRSGSYRRALAAIDPAFQVFDRDCPLFVPLVENGFFAPDDPIPRLTAERYLAPLREANVDTLILGCTHYPLLLPVVAQVMGPDVALIDSGRETALACRRFLQEHGLEAPAGQEGGRRFFVSDRTEGFASIAQILLGESLEGSVAHIDIENFPCAGAEDR